MFTHTGDANGIRGYPLLRGAFAFRATGPGLDDRWGRVGISILSKMAK